MHSILIVEDDHDTRVTLRETLESEGYFVFSAANGIDGLGLLKRISRPSVILLDQNMPLMSGDEFLTLKTRDEAICDIPVLLISAVADRCTRLGALRLLRKPVPRDELLRAVAQFCRSEQRPAFSKRETTAEK